MHYRLLYALEEAAEAGYFGSATLHAIHSGHSVDSIVLYARIAWRHAQLAVEFASPKEVN